MGMKYMDAKEAFILYILHLIARQITCTHLPLHQQHKT